MITIHTNCEKCKKDYSTSLFSNISPLTNTICPNCKHSNSSAYNKFNKKHSKIKTEVKNIDVIPGKNETPVIEKVETKIPDENIPIVETPKIEIPKVETPKINTKIEKKEEIKTSGNTEDDFFDLEDKKEIKENKNAKRK